MHNNLNIKTVNPRVALNNLKNKNNYEYVSKSKRSLSKDIKKTGNKDSNRRESYE